MNRSSAVGMMLQFAFGPGSPGAKPPSGLPVHAGDDSALEASPQTLALAAAARAWWESGRPEGWSLEQHLADPAVGRDGSEVERALSLSVEQLLKQGL